MTLAVKAAVSRWSDHRVVASRLVAGAPAADGTPRLGLHFRLAPEWHVYWRHPGDAGAPPQVAVAAGGVPIPSEISYPAPQRFRLPGGLEALGYAGEVVYPLRLASPPPAGSTITASLDYVACAVECIPYHDELAVTLPVAASSTASGEDELLRRWEARLPRAVEAAGVEWRLRYRTGEAPEIELEVAPDAASSIGGAPPTPTAAASSSDATPGGATAVPTKGPPELFLEPAPGATFASPERIAGDAGAMRFRAAVRPDVAGQPPQRLRVAWTLTRAMANDVALAGVVTVPAGGQVGTSGEASNARSAARSRRDAARQERVPRGALVALLALVPLVAALLLWLIPERLALPAIPPSWLRGASFLAAAVLVWSAYRLGALLPTTQVAVVELSWLAIALAAQGAAAASAVTRRRLWLALALLAAAAGVWAAWSPAMLSS
jgi:hypothetical protein